MTPEETLAAAARRHRAAGVPCPGPLRTGVDLGTATCVLVVLDAAGAPVWLDSHPSGALRDGVVVDFAAAAAAVADLKGRAERALGCVLASAATAYPPGVGASDSRACHYVLEHAGFDEVRMTDEVSAAQALLQIHDGVLVDVGGGSTGVGVYREGRLVDLGDRPGGGHHLDLILAGALRVDPSEAQKRKLEEGARHLDLLRPGFERVAENIRALAGSHDDLDLHLAGGGCMVPGAASVIADRLGRTVRTYPHALLITPLGVAKAAP